MTQAEFITAYTRGEIKVELDPVGSARFLSARLLLPLVMMPVIGIGIALALTGWIYTGILIMAAGIVAPRLIKRSAPHFVLTQALSDASVYDEVTRANILRVTSVISDRG
jgi:hypothetical protein